MPYEVKTFTTVFVDTRLWKTKHSRKRFQNFRQSCMLSTCRIEIHHYQSVLEPFPQVFCSLKSRINENGGNGSLGLDLRI